MKRAYSLIMITLMIGSVFGTLAYYTFFTPNCPLPSGGTPTVLGSGFTNINGVGYTEINVTFTAEAQQIASSSITIRTTSFLDPTIPHLKNGACVTEPDAPFQVALQVTFSDAVSQAFPAFAYGGNPPAQSFGPYFITHQTLQAGVQSLQGQDYLNLFLNTNTA